MVKWVIPEKINTSTMGEISADWTGGKMHLKDVRRVWRGVNFLFTVSEGMEIFCIDPTQHNHVHFLFRVYTWLKIV